MVLFLLPVGVAYAQEQEEEERTIDRSHDRLIKVHPLQVGEVYLSYEKLRTARVSNEIGISYVYQAYFKDDWPFGLDEVDVNGVHIRMSQRYYTSKKKRGTPFGFFYGPMFGYRLMIFEKNALGQNDLAPSDPNYRYVGRLYQNSLELAYQIGGQFKLVNHLTMEISGGLGGRVKYARSVGAEELLTDNIIGHAVVAERNSAIFITPLPQLNVSLGYSF